MLNVKNDDNSTCMLCIISFEDYICKLQSCHLFAIQRRTIKRIQGLANLPYESQLKKPNLYSLKKMCMSLPSRDSKLACNIPNMAEHASYTEKEHFD